MNDHASGIGARMRSEIQKLKAERDGLQCRLRSRLRQIEALTAERDDLAEKLDVYRAELAALRARIDRPQIADFAAALPLEAAHQSARWIDEGKHPLDWLFVANFLAMKAVLTNWERDDLPQRVIDAYQLHRVLGASAGLREDPYDSNIRIVAEIQGRALFAAANVVNEKGDFGDVDKLKHRIVALGAMCANWFRCVSGEEGA